MLGWAAGLLSFGACKPTAREQARGNVAANADTATDNFVDAADNVSAAAAENRLENRAASDRATAENQAEDMRANDPDADLSNGM